jgi:hypothetical protein
MGTEMGEACGLQMHTCSSNAHEMGTEMHKAMIEAFELLLVTRGASE